jgi:hypothetical protein
MRKSGISRSTVADRRGIRISFLFVEGSFPCLPAPRAFFPAGFVVFSQLPDPVRLGSCFLIVLHPYQAKGGFSFRDLKTKAVNQE